jgi:hypothetical protein
MSHILNCFLCEILIGAKIVSYCWDDVFKKPPTWRKSKKGPHAANHGNVRNRLLINPKLYCTAPQTAHLQAMATCYFSWAINMFFLHGFAGSKSTLKR